MLGTYGRQLHKVCDRGGSFDLVRAMSVAYCSVRYGASPNNYETFGFDKIAHRQRRTYLTYRHNQRLMMRANTPEAIERLLDKRRFAQHFSALTGRRTIALSEASLLDVQEFLRSCSNGALIKPRLEGQGRGVRALGADDVRRQGVLSQILDGGEGDAWILDERLAQHSQMTKWFGTGLAPVRLVTGLSAKGAEVMWAAITMGRGGDAINYHLGGVMAPVNALTGRILTPGIDKEGMEFFQHPVSGVDLASVVIPLWSDVTALAKAAAESNPYARYCGWDIGVTENGPYVIEGNHDPGTYSMVQAYAYRKAVGEGLLPIAQRVFDDIL